MACARGRVERIFGSETAREGKGRRGLSRFSRVHNPFPFYFISFQTPVTRAGSRRVTVQDAVSYCTAKFLNLQTKIQESCIQRTSTSCACVKKRKCNLERKIFDFFYLTLVSAFIRLALGSRNTGFSVYINKHINSPFLLVLFIEKLVYIV